MWSELIFNVIDKKFEFINLLRNNLRGNIYFKGFQVEENDIFDWFCSRGRLDEIDFTKNFLLSDKVLGTFKKNGEEINKINKNIVLECKSEFVIDGELAELLYNGGAYGSKYNKSAVKIKNKSRSFCNQLFKEKYKCDYVRYYTCNEAWNSWFIDFIIDYTYIIICMESRTVWELAYTDSD